MPTRTPRFTVLPPSAKPRVITHKPAYDARWRRLRDRRLQANPLCQHCEAKGLLEPALQVDHIKPLALGGQHEWSNTQSLCLPCHRVKTALDIKAIARGNA